MFNLFRAKELETWIVEANTDWEEVWPGMAGDEHIRHIYNGARGVAKIKGQNITVVFDDIKASPYNSKLVMHFKEGTPDYYKFDWIEQTRKKG